MIREAIALAALVACHGILLTAAVAIVRSLARHNQEEQTMDEDTQAALHALEREARALYGSDDVEIDPLTDKDISQAENGTWVRAWVFVPNADDDYEE